MLHLWSPLAITNLMALARESSPLTLPFVSGLAFSDILYTYLIPDLINLELYLKILMSTVSWVPNRPQSLYTQKTNFGPGHIFLLDSMYKKYLLTSAPGLKSSLTLKGISGVFWDPSGIHRSFF